MSTHEANRAKLALAAAGGLSQTELLEVQQHARECESCRREMERWGLYAEGMRRLPQPVLPADLVARTQARVLHAREEHAARRRDTILMGGLAIFSSAMSFVSWLVVRLLTGGTLEAFGTNWVGAGPWFLVWTVVGWVTVGVAAATLSRYRERRLV
jgi:predicted anti-sigma-YlaC factor YlaD